jgi:hypothetical protein
MASEVRLVVAIPSIFARRQVTVDPSITVRELKQRLPDPRCDLLVDGMVMADGAPLASYAVRSGTVIVALAQGAPQARQQWARAMADRDEFQERMAAVVNPSLRSEVGRLMDLRLMRFEARRDFVSRLSAYCSETGIQLGQKVETVLPQSQHKPSTEPLPVAWRAMARLPCAVAFPRGP